MAYLLGIAARIIMLHFRLELSTAICVTRQVWVTFIAHE